MANMTATRIGGNGDNTEWKKFHGSVSCFQIYNTAMNEAELITKKECPDLPPSTKASPCPDGYSKYKQKCIKVIY